MLYNDAQHIFAFFLQSNSRSKTGAAFSVLHFPVLHVSTLEIWSLIFQWCRSLFDLSGLSLVPHFPVLHFQSTLTNQLINSLAT